MSLKDFGIIGKKILVGVLVYLIPVFLIAAGIWLTKVYLSDPKNSIVNRSNVKP